MAAYQERAVDVLPPSTYPSLVLPACAARVSHFRESVLVDGLDHVIRCPCGIVVIRVLETSISPVDPFGHWDLHSDECNDKFTSTFGWDDGFRQWVDAK